MTLLISQSLFVFLFSTVIFLIFDTNGFSLDMIPIDHPDLKFVPRNFSVDDRHKLLVNMSMSRALDIQNKAQLSQNAFQSQVYRFKPSYYVTKLAFGSHGGKAAYNPYMILDTGSAETWVQCEGCKTCFEIRGITNFDYKTSDTYKRMDLRDPLCLGPRFTYDGSCGYTIQYATYRTTGFMGRDTFYFRHGNTDKTDMFPNIAFGCGFENVDVRFWGNASSENVISGVHGLAVGPRSFITQLGGQVNGRFSYCLPPLTPSKTARSTISFGPDAQIGGDAVKDVKTISMFTTGRYHLFLSAISVDGIRIPLDPSIFELDEERHTKGFFVDSGSPFSTFPRRAYNPLRDAIAKYFNQYGWQPVNDTRDFDLCYDNYPNEQQSFPSVTFHFVLNGNPGEADMELGLGNMFQSNIAQTNFCLAVLVVPDPGPTLFGAFQQQNFRYLFDVNGGFFQFVPEICVGS